MNRSRRAGGDGSHDQLRSVGVDAEAGTGGVRARGENGRLVVNEPTSLPEGMILDLVLDDEGDDLDEAERAARDDALERAWQQAQAGLGRPAGEVIDELRRHG